MRTKEELLKVIYKDNFSTRAQAQAFQVMAEVLVDVRDLLTNNLPPPKKGEITNK